MNKPHTRLRRCGALAAALVLLSSSALGWEARVQCPNGLWVSAQIDPRVKDFHFWENLSFTDTLPHLKGILRIENPGTKALPFRNPMLTLSGEAVPSARPYVISVASPLVDHGEVQIAPGQPLILSVYWPVPLAVGSVIQQQALACRAA